MAQVNRKGRSYDKQGTPRRPVGMVQGTRAQVRPDPPVELEQVPQTPVVPAFTPKDKRTYPERKRREQIRTFTAGRLDIPPLGLASLPRDPERRRVVIYNHNSLNDIHWSHREMNPGAAGGGSTGFIMPPRMVPIEVISGMEIFFYNTHADQTLSVSLLCEYLMDVE